MKNIKIKLISIFCASLSITLGFATNSLAMKSEDSSKITINEKISLNDILPKCNSILETTNNYINSFKEGAKYIKIKLITNLKKEFDETYANYQEIINKKKGKNNNKRKKLKSDILKITEKIKINFEELKKISEIINTYKKFKKHFKTYEEIKNEILNKISNYEDISKKINETNEEYEKTKEKYKKYLNKYNQILKNEKIKDIFTKIINNTDQLLKSIKTINNNPKEIIEQPTKNLYENLDNANNKTNKKQKSVTEIILNYYNKEFSSMLDNMNSIIDKLNSNLLGYNNNDSLKKQYTETIIAFEDKKNEYNEYYNELNNELKPSENNFEIKNKILQNIKNIENLIDNDKKYIKKEHLPKNFKSQIKNLKNLNKKVEKINHNLNLTTENKIKAEKIEKEYNNKKNNLCLLLKKNKNNINKKSIEIANANISKNTENINKNLENIYTQYKKENSICSGNLYKFRIDFKNINNKLSDIENLTHEEKIEIKKNYCNLLKNYSDFIINNKTKIASNNTWYIPDINNTINTTTLLIFKNINNDLLNINRFLFNNYFLDTNEITKNYNHFIKTGEDKIEQYKQYKAAIKNLEYEMKHSNLYDATKKLLDIKNLIAVNYFEKDENENKKDYNENNVDEAYKKGIQIAINYTILLENYKHYLTNGNNYTKIKYNQEIWKMMLRISQNIGKMYKKKYTLNNESIKENRKKVFLNKNYLETQKEENYKENDEDKKEENLYDNIQTNNSNEFFNKLYKLNLEAQKEENHKENYEDKKEENLYDNIQTDNFNEFFNKYYKLNLETQKEENYKENDEDKKEENLYDNAIINNLINIEKLHDDPSYSEEDKKEENYKENDEDKKEENLDDNAIINNLINIKELDSDTSYSEENKKEKNK